MHSSSLSTRLRLRLAAILAAAALGCILASNTWCADLWFANYQFDTIEWFSAKQLSKNGTPAPDHFGLLTGLIGLAFDPSHNLWVTVGGGKVEEFTPAQLKKMHNQFNPVAAKTITSSTFDDILGCAFDHHGNLWVTDTDDAFYELSKAQLKAGGSLTPAIIITSTELHFPNFITFDKAGDAWLDSPGSDQLAEFDADHLTSGGAKIPDVIISDDGTGTSLDAPGEIVFDKSGDLWVPNLNGGTVSEYTPQQLKESGNPSPTVKLSATGDSLDRPWSAAFDGSSLIVYNFASGTFAKFSSDQLKVSGAPVPAVFLDESDNEGYQLIVGPQP
jgi:sugar lactone lactonase YvrE